MKISTENHLNGRVAHEKELGECWMHHFTVNNSPWTTLKKAGECALYLENKSLLQ
jgi:hypothetical protein